MCTNYKLDSRVTKGDIFKKVDGLKSKNLDFFRNGKVRRFLNYHSCRIWAIFGNFRASGVKIGIKIKQKNLK